MLIPVIISGGAGARLWPVSREMHPKPFIRLSDQQSLIEKTFLRSMALPEVTDILTVTNQNLLFLTKDACKQSLKIAQQPAIQPHYLLEPVGRNTAPAIAAAAAYIATKFGGQHTMLVLAADHVILNQVGFIEAVQQAQRLAQQGRLVTFGIQPNRPETGYGYIEAQGSTVVQFVEKPDLPTATQYVESGRFLWNAGIFCFTAETLLREIEQHHPALKATVDACVVAMDMQSDVAQLPINLFGQAENISIDYAVMEKSNNVSVVACDIGWSDIGSWSSLSELTAADSAGNQVEANTLLNNTQNCYIRSDQSNRLIATLDVQDLVIVDTPDALLIANRTRTQEVKQIVEQLKKDNSELYQLHRTVFRPWGTYTTLEEGDGFKIKRIVVKAGESLSLQMHHHRSEHWVVVSGVAKVINGDQERLVHPNQSTYIPAGQTHRLTNPGIIDCVMIEVQVGSYLGEDDIVRFTDIYGRKIN